MGDHQEQEAPVAVVEKRVIRAHMRRTSATAWSSGWYGRERRLTRVPISGRDSSIFLKRATYSHITPTVSHQDIKCTEPYRNLVPICCQTRHTLMIATRVGSVFRYSRKWCSSDPEAKPGRKVVVDTSNSRGMNVASRRMSYQSSYGSIISLRPSAASHLSR